MLSKNHPTILFIDRNGFSLYQDTLANIPRFNFTPDLVANLDVTNKEQFINLITTFIQINKIIPGSLAVILSDNVIYAKDLQGTDQRQNFLENIPFENVLAKMIKTENISRIVAVNKDLVMTIINAFIGKGFSEEAVAPGFMYGQSANFTMGLTLDNVRIILGNLETLKLGNLLTNQEEIVSSQSLRSEGKKSQNLRQYILIGAFMVLLVILAIVYFKS